MKKETIIWQVIVIFLGLFLIITTRTYLQAKISLDAATNRANCVANNDEKGLNIYEMCIKINQDIIQ